MLEKIFSKKKAASSQESANQEQQSGEKGKPNYLVLILGIMVMVVGVSVIGYKFLMSGQQQRVNVDRSVIQDQKQSQDRRQSSADTNNADEGALEKLQKEDPGSENPLGSEGEKKSAADTGKTEQEEPSGDTQAADLGPESNASKDVGLKEMASEQGTEKDRTRRPSKRMEPGKLKEVSKKLDSIKDLVKSEMDTIGDRIGNVQSELDTLRGKVEQNGERLRQVAKKAGNATGFGVSAEKYATLKAAKGKLESKVADLKDRVEELDGKYDWVRHLEQKRRKKLNEAKKKLSRVKDKLKQRPVFADWAMVGLSEDEVVLKNKYDGTIRRLSEGDQFNGVKVEDVNFEKRMVRTDAGIVGEIKR